MNDVTLLDIISKYWALITSTIVFIVWLVRLEVQGTSNSTRIKKLEDKDEELDKLKTLVERIDAKLSVLLPDYEGKS